jgi:hypothetical protein
MLFRIDEALSWETVQHLEPLLVSIGNLAAQDQAPEKVREEIEEVTDIFNQVHYALNQNGPL